LGKRTVSFIKPISLTNFHLGSSFNTTEFFSYSKLYKIEQRFILRQFQTRKGILNDLRSKVDPIKSASTTEFVLENDGE